MSQSATIPLCWNKENVGKAISINAKIDDKQTHYFLASHSPMHGIQDEKSKRKIAEEELYKSVMTSGQRDKQVVIYGEPGTGKSHLVHWLKLRFDYGVATDELRKVVPVLVERRSGSLKDALTQLIEQLGDSFQKYLDPVQEALEKLSDATARQMLVNELSLELGPRWTDRGRPRIDKRLKHLGQACRSEGFGGWLCRDGGVVEKRINLLLESSEVNDRENSQQFQPEDLLVKDRFRTRRKNSQEVLDLIDELDDSKGLRDLAAEHMNHALKDAIRDMVGLNGANLRKVFDLIREDLASEGKQLALFIEDVSAMSELDVEIVNALEPQDRTDLCPLTAVLGMTHTGYAKLRDNQKQRIEFVFRLDGETTKTWSDDKDSLAKFTARYLNSIRLEEDEVRKVADDRRKSNGDIATSKCTGCSAKELCHSTFGSVDINGTEVGLYPFSVETAPRVLELIDNDDSSPYSANQRGLLIRLISPVMSDVSSLVQNNFPNVATLPVRVTDPYYWTAFQQQYLGNYSETERSRIQILAGLWIEATDDTDRAASLLKRFLEPLQLPAFTKEARKVTPAKKAGGITPTVRTATEAESKAKDQVKKYLDALSAWLQGETLKHEAYFRDLLSSLVKNSVRWENYLQPAQFLTWTWDMVSGRKFIYIEGQASTRERLRFEFPREESTRQLLEALCRHEKEGGKSWEFELGQTHKRVVANWIRTHEAKIVNALEPEIEPTQAIRTSIEFLSLYYVVRNRSKLPQKSISELTRSIFGQGWDERPTGLSKSWQFILEELDIRHEQVLNFLKNEVSVRQGRGGINFISPLTIVDNTSQFNDIPRVSSLSPVFHSSFWKSRFDGLPKDQFSNLSQAIEDERLAVSVLVSEAKDDLASLGFACDDTRVEMMQFFDQVVELNEAIKRAKVTLPDQEYDDLVKAKIFTEQKMVMANALAKAEEVAGSNDPFGVLTFDPTQLNHCCSVISVVSRRIVKLDAYISEQEEDIKKDGDPEAICKQMFKSLGQFSELSEEILEVAHVETS